MGLLKVYHLQVFSHIKSLNTALHCETYTRTAMHSCQSQLDRLACCDSNKKTIAVSLEVGLGCDYDNIVAVEHLYLPLLVDVQLSNDIQ